MSKYITATAKIAEAHDMDFDDNCDVMLDGPLKVMVLTGGPDRERPVSFMSSAEVAPALQQAGHEVLVRDVVPDDVSCLEEFSRWGGDMIFPAIHGVWGEGGPLQQLLDDRGLAYIGSDAAASALCMDKDRAKQVWARHGLATPAHEMVGPADSVTLSPPVVVKPACEGSSIDMAICHDQQQLDAARHELHKRRGQLMIEQFVSGKELTVAVLAASGGGGESGGGEGGSDEALDPIHIIPATAFYDYQAKYERDDTQYLFDIDLPKELLDDIRHTAQRAHALLGCRHISRVDFIVDQANQPWLLEVNTIPGFTSHSLVPMAARHAGINMVQLCDRLLRAAVVTVA